MFTVTECFDCSLGRNAINIVNGRITGDDPKIMLLGEAPGAEEDKTGLPFQGKSGILIDRAIERAGVAVHITNCVRCRPPDNRNPTQKELVACYSHLKKEIKELDPIAIITLGRVPLKNLIYSTGKGTLLSWMVKGPLRYYFDDKIIPVYPRYHPAYILRNQSKMDAYVTDLAFLLGEINDNEKEGE